MSSEMTLPETIEEIKVELGAISALSYEERQRRNAAFHERWMALSAKLSILLTEKAVAEGLFPVGFTPVFIYPGGTSENAKITPGVVRVLDKSFSVDDDFASESLPSLPIKESGEIWSLGWDIPTRWAIDASGQAWIDDAHGGSMSRCTYEELKGEVGDDTCLLNKIHALLGKKEVMPSWMKVALANGWTPSKSFDRSKYE